MLLVAQQVRHGLCVIPAGHQRTLTCQQLGVRAVLVDGEVIDDRLHGKGYGRFQIALGLRHDLVQPILGPRLHVGVEDEAHAAARHAAHHPETPEIVAKLLLYLTHEPFRVGCRRPGNDGLDGAEEIAVRGRADRSHIAVIQQLQYLVDNQDRFLPPRPFGLGAQQVLLRHHLQDRARHPAPCPRGPAPGCPATAGAPPPARHHGSGCGGWAAVARG